MASLVMVVDCTKFSRIGALLPITLQAPYWNKRPLPSPSAFLNTDISIKDIISLPFYCYIQTVLFTFTIQGDPFSHST